jgi:deoxyribose-phosphate aldolase
MNSEYLRIVEEVTRRVLSQIDGPVSIVPSVQTALSVCAGADGSCLACGKCAELRPDDMSALRSAGASRLSSAAGIGKVRDDLARMIDHTLLKPEATRDQLRTICEEAVKFGFYSVCVNSANVRFCANLLRGSDIKVVAVVGFPLGAMSSQSKAFETKQAIRDGAREIDMVLNIGKLKTGDYDCVFEDIMSVVSAAQPYPVKVIIETSALQDEEKVAACALSSAAGARFVKTSTGFGKGGAKVEDIALMRRVVGDKVQIKASGGIHNAQDADSLVEAGATRLGTSASVTIVSGGTSKSSY